MGLVQAGQMKLLLQAAFYCYLCSTEFLIEAAEEENEMFSLKFTLLKVVHVIINRYCNL
jgi:hypothetical protein